MSTAREPTEDPALQRVEELFKIIIATAGVVLTLLWGLTQRALTTEMLFMIRLASIVLVTSIFLSLVGYSFIVSELQRGKRRVSKSPSIAISFFLAETSFVLGCVFLILAIFRVQTGTD